MSEPVLRHHGKAREGTQSLIPWKESSLMKKLIVLALVGAAAFFVYKKKFAA